MTLSFDYSGLLYFAAGVLFGILIGPAALSLLKPRNKFMEGFKHAAVIIVSADDPADAILYLLNKVEESKAFDTYDQYDGGVEAAVEMFIDGMKNSAHIVDSYEVHRSDTY